MCIRDRAGTFAHNVTLADGTILMPLIIEWSSSENNPVSELLNVMLAQGPQTAEAGMKINQNVMTFTELLNYYYRDASQGDKYAVPTYGMFNLASNFTPAYDQSYEWTLDPEMVAQGYNLNRLYNETMDALSMNMVYGVDSSNTQLYMTYWKGFQMLWNELLPQIPLYSNIYITVYPDWLENYTQDSFWDFQQAILYAVSYTHLDVYKRQRNGSRFSSRRWTSGRRRRFCSARRACRTRSWARIPACVTARRRANGPIWAARSAMPPSTPKGRARPKWSAAARKSTPGSSR